MRNEMDISRLYKELCALYEDADYVSRATIFNRAMWDGKITEQVRDRACDFYGSLWNYVGD